MRSKGLKFDDVDSTLEELPLATPTVALPGSKQKIKIMEERYVNKMQIFHPKDGRITPKIEDLLIPEIVKVTDKYTDEFGELVLTADEIRQEALTNISEQLLRNCE